MAIVDPQQLRMLALVEAHGSLSGAAAELGVTPGALTGQVARAERDWGLPLVRRGPRGARLTEAGTALARHGLSVDDACRRASLELDVGRDRTRRRLRIGTFMSAALQVLPEAVTALRHRHPDSDLSILEGTSSDLRARLVAGDLDLVVAATYDDRPQLPRWVSATPLLTDPLVVCLPVEHRLARTPPEHRVRLSRLRGEAWIALLAGDTARAQFDRAAAQHDLAPRVQFQTESYDVAQALVATGLGVAVLSRLAARPTPGVVHRPLERPRLQRRLWALHPSDTRLTPLADELGVLLREVGNEVQERWHTEPLEQTVGVVR